MDPSEEIPETHFQSQNLKQLLSTLNLSKNDFGHIKKKAKHKYAYLFEGFAIVMKNMSSSVGMMKFPIYGKIKLGLIFPTLWKVIKFHGSKPPTRLLLYMLVGYSSDWSWGTWWFVRKLIPLTKSR